MFDNSKLSVTKRKICCESKAKCHRNVRLLREACVEKMAELRTKGKLHSCAGTV
jgi:hypothetical protein